MSFVSHSAATAPVPSLMRRLVLAASAVAAAVAGTASAGESAAADLFVAKVMMVQTSHVAPPGQPGVAADRTVDTSAQDQFVDRVLRGRLPESELAGRNTNVPSNDPPSWPDVSFLRATAPRQGRSMPQP